MGAPNLGSKVRYALLAAMDLAAHYDPDTPVKVEEIAGRTGAPAKYLAQILLLLKAQALVRSRQGPGGGYILMRRPELISAAEVWEAAAAADVSGEWIADSPYGAALHWLAAEVAEGERRFLASVSLADLVQRMSSGTASR